MFSRPTILLTFLSLSLVVGGSGCGDRPFKLSPEMQRSLNEAIAFADDYKTSHGAYPDRQQFHSWRNPRDLRGVVDYSVDTSGTNSRYRVYIWLGEHMRVYLSDRKTMVEPETLKPPSTSPRL
jgi:hypothetical protein